MSEKTAAYWYQRIAEDVAELGFVDPSRYEVWNPDSGWFTPCRDVLLHEAEWHPKHVRHKPRRITIRGPGGEYSYPEPFQKSRLLARNTGCQSTPLLILVRSSGGRGTKLIGPSCAEDLSTSIQRLPRARYRRDPRRGVRAMKITRADFSVARAVIPHRDGSCEVVTQNYIECSDGVVWLLGNRVRRRHGDIPETVPVADWSWELTRRSQ